MGKYGPLVLLVMLVIFLVAFLGGAYRGIIEPRIDEAVPDANVGIACKVFKVSCPEDWLTPTVTPIPTITPSPILP